jgi:beta-lactamase superfamily II metal-dependent hydrolase
MAKDTKYTDKISVKKVIYSQPNDEHLKHVGKEYRKVWMPDALEGWKPDEVVKAHPGQKFYFADVTVTILGSQDLVLPGTIDSHNNMSVVSKVEFMDYEFLYLADAEGIMNRQLETLYGEELKADVLQAAHHGYNNTEAEKVYALVDPMMVFWPLSTKEYRNCSIESISFNKRFFKNGIDNYVAGETNMTITDFYSWIPDERWDPMPR